MKTPYTLHAETSNFIFLKRRDCLFMTLKEIQELFDIGMLFIAIDVIPMKQFAIICCQKTEGFKPGAIPEELRDEPIIIKQKSLIQVIQQWANGT